jgi:D-xylose transport system ATP-binding protein
MTADTATPVLQMEGISKRFGAVQALTEVSFEVSQGEVVALVGDNGAGKSTLIKVVAGVGPNDEGVIRFEGKEVTISKPLDATALGIATVYQDLALCDNLDVVANLFLGREDTRTALLDEVTMEKRATELLRSLAAKIPSVRIPVASLSGGQRQTVAISRSLVGDPKVVILDEPTAALGVAQTAQVLDLIERLKHRGHAVILITHNLADANAVCDRIVVLRLGRNAGEFRVGEVSQEEIVATITGAMDNVVTRRAARHTPADIEGASPEEAEPSSSGDGHKEVEL